MGWEEMRKERDKKKDREVIKIEEQKGRREVARYFPDSGRVCGKSDKENPLISRQLNHMELGSLPGVIFLFSNSSPFSSSAMGWAGIESQRV